MADVLGSLIGVGGNLLGGLLNTIAGGRARDDAQAMANEQMAQQRLFATTGLQWRAGDAMKAYAATGIHPLALLGVQGPSYSPVNFVGGADTSMGDAVARSGQDISRAIAAGSDRESRNAMATRFDNLTQERMQLDNELIRTRIASERARLLGDQLGPAMPSGRPGVVPGTNVVGPSWEYVKTPTGYMLLKSDAAQKRLEDDIVGTSIWNVGHRAAVPPMPPPTGVKLNTGEKWVWRPASQEWQIERLGVRDIRRMMPHQFRQAGAPSMSWDWLNMTGRR